MSSGDNEQQPDEAQEEAKDKHATEHRGALLRAEPNALDAIREPALVAVTHVLATESFTSFDALGGTHAR